MLAWAGRQGWCPSLSFLSHAERLAQRATVGYGSVVKAAQAIAPYVDGFPINNIRPSDPRMIGFLQALSQASSS